MRGSLKRAVAEPGLWLRVACASRQLFEVLTRVRHLPSGGHERVARAEAAGAETGCAGSRTGAGDRAKREILKLPKRERGGRLNQGRAGGREPDGRHDGTVRHGQGMQRARQSRASSAAGFGRRQNPLKSYEN